ncbi:hypothetical protein HMPREF0574_1662 [Mobiluncus curtisii subsp. curtisii ATCC 35241]|nr:hypothetical protein HMPREF0574_1662 [Mobiluncus curtisii subsp. curtisii ATCC 35241]
MVSRPAENRAHPRECGDHLAPVKLSTAGGGSSPRVRGPQHAHPYKLKPVGLIPASAGTTDRRGWRNTAAGAHPRECGDH